MGRERRGLQEGKRSPEIAPSVLRAIIQRKIKSDRAEEIQHGEQGLCGHFNVSSGDKGNNAEL